MVAHGRSRTYGVVASMDRLALSAVGRDPPTASPRRVVARWLGSSCKDAGTKAAEGRPAAPLQTRRVGGR